MEQRSEKLPEDLKPIDNAEFIAHYKEHLDWLKNKKQRGIRLELSYKDLSSIDFVNRTNLDSANLSFSAINDIHIYAPCFNGADLSNCDASGAIFKSISLQDFTNPAHKGYRLEKPSFVNADISRANFNNTIIKNGLFEHANLEGCTFYNAQLIDCDFTDAKGLHASLFAGADLTGTKIPEAISKFEARGHAEKLSQITKRAFFALLLACIFSCLSIANTFGPNNASTNYTTPLPVLGTTIPFSWLYMVLPILLIAMNLYFALFFQRYAETVSTLPANFEDGRPLHRVLDPWIFSSMLYSYIPLFQARIFPLKRIQHLLSVFAGWWIVPLTLFLLGF